MFFKNGINIQIIIPIIKDIIVNINEFLIVPLRKIRNKILSIRDPINIGNPNKTMIYFIKLDMPFVYLYISFITIL